MRRTLVLLWLGLAIPVDARAQPRGGTTLPVGNVGGSAVLPTGQFITGTRAAAVVPQILGSAVVAGLAVHRDHPGQPVRAAGRSRPDP